MRFEKNETGTGRTGFLMDCGVIVRNLAMEFGGLPVHFGFDGKGFHKKDLFSFGPFDGERYIENEGFEKGVWLTRGGLPFWVIPPRKAIRECPVCNEINSVDQKYCVLCGTVLWKTDRWSKEIARARFTADILGNTNKRLAGTLDRLIEIREMVVESALGGPLMKNEDLEPLGFKVVPERFRRFDPRAGYYVSRDFRF